MVDEVEVLAEAEAEPTPPPVYGVFDRTGRLVQSSENPADLMRNLSRRQFNLMIRRVSISRADIEAAIRASIQDPDQREDALIEFEDATEYERSHALVAMVAASIGYSTQRMDELWREASAL